MTLTTVLMLTTARLSSSLMYRMEYTDLAEVSDWAFEAIAWCNMNGIINGKGDNILDPKGNAKRCEAAAMLMRYIED